jgi:hypothetical protein
LLYWEEFGRLPSPTRARISGLDVGVLANLLRV